MKNFKSKSNRYKQKISGKDKNSCLLERQGQEKIDVEVDKLTKGLDRVNKLLKDHDLFSALVYGDFEWIKEKRPKYYKEHKLYEAEKYLNNILGEQENTELDPDKAVRNMTKGINIVNEVLEDKELLQALADGDFKWILKNRPEYCKKHNIYDEDICNTEYEKEVLKSITKHYKDWTIISGSEDFGFTPNNVKVLYEDKIMILNDKLWNSANSEFLDNLIDKIEREYKENNE